MKQKVVNQELKKNFILYKGHTGWKVKTRIFGSLVVTLSALTLAEGLGTTTVHAATDPAAGQITKPVEQQKQSAPTSGNSTPQAPAAVKSNVDSAAGAGGPATSGDDSTGSGNGQSSNGTQLQQNVVVESESLTGDAAAANQTAAGTTNDATSDPKYPVLSQDKATNIGVDTSEVSLTASQIADHFTATVENRDGNDKDYDAKDNTKTAKIHPDGSVALTSNDPHQVYDASGNASSVTGHQAAHVSFEHEVDFSHNFSLSGALGIGSKSSGADSVGFIFAPVDPAEATNGGSGGQLGLQGLANAFGLVYDQYNNTGANDANHNRFNDPEDGSFQPYIGWRTTDAGGILQAAARSDWKAASEAGLNDRETNPLNDFTMDYNATTHVLTATLGTAQFTRTITDTTQGYSISVSASTGGAWNDYSARIDKFTYTPKTIPLTVHLVDSADSDAPLNNADVTAIANIGDTVSVFSTQDAAARAVAKGLVDPSLVSVLPGDSAGNIYVIDGSQTPSSNGKSKTIDGSGVSDDTYYAYTVTDAAKQSVTVPVRLAFTANVTPVDAATGKKIDGLDPVTVVAVAGEPTLVQIPGYTPTTVTLDAPTNGEKIANDVLPIDQGATNPSSTTTKDKATPVSHYYTGTGTTVDGTTVTTKATVGTGQSISTDLNKQPLVDANGDPIVSGGKAIGSNDYYWSTTSNAGATDSTDETKPQTSGSLLLPTGTTLDYWESQAAANQTLADTYNTQAQTMYQEFMKITGLTPAQQEDAQKLLQGVSGIYSSVSASNKTAKDDFEAAKTATVATDIYQDGQNGYAYLKKVQNLLASFKLDLTNLGTKQTDAESSLATFKSWSENYGAEIKLPSADFVSFGPDFWTNGAETTADFNNPAYYEYYSTNTADGAPVTPKNVGNYFFKLTNAGRKYLINLNPNNDKIGLYVSAMLTINPVGAVATVKDATVEYGGGSATDGTVGTWPTFTGSLGSANADHTIDQSDFEVVDDDNNDAVVKYITQLKVNGHYTIRYTQAAQDDLAKDKNYTFTSFGTAKLTVNPRPITVTAQNHGKTYSVPAATDPTLDLTSDSANGLVNGDSIDSLGVKLHRADGEHAGIYAITKDTANSTLNSNYAITVNQGVFTIAQAPVKVQASDLSKTYGDADKTLTLFDATLDDGYQLTDKDVTLTRVAGENVGDYQITGSAVSTSNYNVTVTPGTFTIKKRAVMVQIENQSKTYDDDVSTDPALSWKVVSEQGLAPNETSDVLNVKLNQQAGETIGHHAITGTFDNANYDVHFIDGNLLINPRVVGLIVDPQGKTYGDDDADHPLTCHLADGSTLAADQKLADLVTLTRDTGEDVGDYAITVTPKSNNYTFEVT
ncbi:MBG domain-containing protein, partial [Levilactobacillus enshiensis]|uniref:MBG domain-containing protein n=1 Tax=Levilactobacillus enshiensis TaxID=2590213 RepID=UPI001179DE68